MATNADQAHAVAGKLAQVIGEAQIHAAPIIAHEHHAEGYRQLETWLDRLEGHTSGQVGPFLEHVLANSSPPPFLRHLLEEAIDPPEQFSAILEQVFLYGIVSNIIGTSIQPFMQGVTNELTKTAVGTGIVRPVNPSVIAVAVARGLEYGAPPTTTVPDWAYEQAAMSGVSKEDMDLQASIVGTPPAPQELFELERRGLLQPGQLETGLREGDTRDDWIPQLVQLAHSWLTPLDFVRAAVQGQMSYADAADWANKTGPDTSTGLPITASEVGGSDDMFGLAWAIAGRPPGPQELARMTRRGIIQQEGMGAGALTFQQGIAESDVKTKWTDALFKLSEYLPPVGEIGTLLERGGLTSDQAVTLWGQQGVPTAIAQAYAYIASQQHIGQDKLLARGQVVTGYYDGILSHQQATQALDDLGYRDDVASEILSISDFRREIRAIDAIARKIETLYGSHKLSATDAKSALVAVGIDPAQADKLLGLWDTFRVEPVRLPSAAEIGMALKYGGITQQEGLDELAALGYQPRDAAIVLTAHSQIPVKPLPAAGTTVTG